MIRALFAPLALVAALSSPASAGPDILSLPFATDLESRQISVVVDRGLARTRDLPTEELRNARVALLAGETLAPEMLQALADKGDTLAALRYVDVLMSRGISQAPSDVAWYAAIAVGGGRVWALPEMVRALHMLDPETEPKARVNKYIQVLYPHAWAGNSLALDAVIDFNGQGRLFGPLSAATKARIDAEVAKTNDGRHDLKLALRILRQGDLTEKDRATALEHLLRAKQADHLAVATTAANLIEQLAQRQDEESAAATN